MIVVQKHKTYRFWPSNIRLARESRGLTITELAKKISIIHTLIRGIEAGKNELSETEMQVFAKALNYPLAFFENKIEPLDLSAEINARIGRYERLFPEPKQRRKKTLNPIL